MELLEDRTLEQFEHFLGQAEALRSNIKTEFKIVTCVEQAGRTQDSFPKGGTKAPYYLIITSELKQDYLLNAGFLMQQAVLYLTARGIATCYQGIASFADEITSEMEGEYVTAVAFGRPKGEVYREPQKLKRQADEKMIVWKEEPGENLRMIMKAAVAAPSACNLQPWRFVAYENRVHLFCRKNSMFQAVLSDIRLLDMGIMIANLYTAAEELWLDVSFSRSEMLAEKRFQNNEYITTAVFREKIF